VVEEESASEGLASLEDVFAVIQETDESAETEEEEAQAAPDPAEEREPREPDETPTPEPAKAPPAVDEAGLKLARIAAAERELSERRREEQELLQTLETRTQAVLAKEAKFKEAQAFLDALERGDVLAALETKGYSLEQINQAAVAGQGLRPNRDLEEQVRATREELARFQEQQRTAVQQAEYSRQMEYAKQTTVREIQARSPLLAAVGDEGVELVLGLAQQVQNSGITPTYEKVIADAEQRLHGFITQVMAVEAVRQKYMPTPSPDTRSEPTSAKTRAVSNAVAGTPARQAERPDLLDMPKEEALDFMLKNGLFAT
jgi:hypothetical protein